MALHEGTGQGGPLGATIVDGGVNFSLFSRNATGVELLFFDRDDDAKPSRLIALDPVASRTYHPKTSSNGRMRRRFPAAPTGPERGRWSFSIRLPVDPVEGPDTAPGAKPRATASAGWDAEDAQGARVRRQRRCFARSVALRLQLIEGRQHRSALDMLDARAYDNLV